jgi:hypothetical protein
MREPWGVMAPRGIRFERQEGIPPGGGASPLSSYPKPPKRAIDATSLLCAGPAEIGGSLPLQTRFVGVFVGLRGRWTAS